MASFIDLKKQADASVSLQNFEQAIALYTQCLSIQPNDAIIFSNRSLCYSRLKKHAKSLQDAENAIKHRPDWIKGYMRKATALSSLGKFSAALSSLHHIHTLIPSAPPADYLPLANQVIESAIQDDSSFIFSNNESFQMLYLCLSSHHVCACPADAWLALRNVLVSNNDSNDSKKSFILSFVEKGGIPLIQQHLFQVPHPFEILRCLDVAVHAWALLKPDQHHTIAIQLHSLHMTAFSRLQDSNSDAKVTHEIVHNLLKINVKFLPSCPPYFRFFILGSIDFIKLLCSVPVLRQLHQFHRKELNVFMLQIPSFFKAAVVPSLLSKAEKSVMHCYLNMIGDKLSSRSIDIMDKRLLCSYIGEFLRLVAEMLAEECGPADSDAALDTCTEKILDPMMELASWEHHKDAGDAFFVALPTQAVKLPQNLTQVMMCRMKSGVTNCFSMLHFLMDSYSHTYWHEYKEQIFPFVLRGFMFWENNLQALGMLQLVLTVRYFEDKRAVPLDSTPRSMDGMLWMMDADMVKRHSAHICGPSKSVLDLVIERLKLRIATASELIDDPSQKLYIFFEYYTEIFFALFNLVQFSSSASIASNRVIASKLHPSAVLRVQCTEQNAMDIMECLHFILTQKIADPPISTDTEEHSCIILCYLLEIHGHSAALKQKAMDLGIIQILVSLMRKYKPCPVSISGPCAKIIQTLAVKK